MIVPITKIPWIRVVFAADCDDVEGSLVCPQCCMDYDVECSCPGPMEEGYEYRTIRGLLHARPTTATAE